MVTEQHRPSVLILTAQQGLFMRGGVPRNLRGARWAARFLKRHRADVVMSFPPRPVQSAMIALLGRS
jgi:hypothetical protein